MAEACTYAWASLWYCCCRSSGDSDSREPLVAPNLPPTYARILERYRREHPSHVVNESPTLKIVLVAQPVQSRLMAQAFLWLFLHLYLVVFPILIRALLLPTCIWCYPSSGVFLVIMLLVVLNMASQWRRVYVVTDRLLLRVERGWFPRWGFAGADVRTVELSSIKRARLAFTFADGTGTVVFETEPSGVFGSIPQVPRAARLVEVLKRRRGDSPYPGF